MDAPIVDVATGEWRRPVEVAVDELVIHTPRGVRTLYWNGYDWEPRLQGDRPGRAERDSVSGR